MFVPALAACLMFGSPLSAFAHCDSLDGPVARAVAQALALRDAAYVLIWVQPDGEDEVRSAFAQALAVRELSPQARALADRYFLETVVRIHRAGEGAPFTGLKPAGQIEPAISAADRALAEGSLTTLKDLLTTEFSAALRRQFEEVASARSYDPNDLAAGRKFVQAYVEYVHFVERLHEAITTAPHGHFTESAPPR
jgi:hypothetical protein